MGVIYNENTKKYVGTSICNLVWFMVSDKPADRFKIDSHSKNVANPNDVTGDQTYSVR